MSIRPCSRKACNEIFHEDDETITPFVMVKVQRTYYGYCSPRCASIDLTERFAPSVGLVP